MTAISAGHVELATGFTVADYFAAVGKQDRATIADAIHRRFRERYLDPVSDNNAPRHGFTMMAVGCLMIEALESFRRGWPDTSQRGQGEHAFCSFFDAHTAFAIFRGHARDFWRGVRCGILHQAETSLGWRIRRDGELLTMTSGARVINATLFVAALGTVLDDYREALNGANWDSEIWECLRTKMKKVCANCEVKTIPS
ncbi:MAG: hypothetical protein ACREK6_00135 [Candidatus Rokuibacteriota bacterium]